MYFCHKIEVVLVMYPPRPLFVVPNVIAYPLDTECSVPTTIPLYDSPLIHQTPSDLAFTDTLSRILFGTRPSVQTVLGDCLKRICSLNTSAFSALEVLDDNCSL